MLRHENCISFLQNLKARSTDLFCTSPPYAGKRSKFYPTVSEADYPQWTLRWMEATPDALKPTGSVAMVIRSHVRIGSVSPYVLKTRDLLHRNGWHEPEELIWIKDNSPPVGHKKRPRRSWEQILWFSRNPKQVFCDTKANGKPSDRIGMPERNGRKGFHLGFFEPYPKDYGSGIARCTDVCQVGCGGNHKAEWNTHPAQYPEPLTDWIIKLLCPPGGLVVDPFCGSGTTLVSAHRLSRRWAGCDLVKEYLDIARRRLIEAGWNGRSR
jgi:DNA modification methylase